MSQDNTRGLKRIVRRAQSALLPRAPFAPNQQHKGIWKHVTRAPNHAWRRYRVFGSIERPLKLIVLSDLHVGSHANDAERFRGIIADVLAQKPDLCLLPGDFVNMQFSVAAVSYLRRSQTCLNRCRARCRAMRCSAIMMRSMETRS